MQRSDLEAEISRLLGDPNNSRWTVAVIDTRLDAAEVDVLKWTNATKKATSYTPVAGSNYVTVGTRILDILDATFLQPDGTIKGAKNRFDPISVWDLNFNRPNWRNESPGEPILWAFDATNNRVILVPAPDATNAIASALTLLEVDTPTTPLSQGTASSVPFDSNSLMVPYGRALVYWVVSECLKDNNDSDSLQKARYFRSNDMQRPGEYEKEVKQILMKFDVPEAVPASVKFQPTGGRISGNGMNQKSNPLGWGLW
jgi:hypothetical protein